ncbi:phosphoadenosine phosphosulfate reductase family protein [Salmonella enterica subsp. enterica serovar Carrau]|nr:phosphoadenosine phosphosulfate reductase family protein [Salmonella enterica subsp. enterica serovar Carrau]PVI43234.1 hypothetical protein C4874_04235 [Salmonella enterica subsp. enterica serovar Carrau]
MVREIELAYNRYLTEFRIPDDHKIIVNFSAGKDSTTTATIANHLFGDRVQNVMADTDNEHELTVDFARNIHHQIGCKPVQIVKRVYTESEFERRRQSLIKRWAQCQPIHMGAYRGVVDRVGCMNCVLCTKEEIAQTAARWPEHIEKHHAWEKKVRLASRWVHWMSVGTESQAWMRSQLGVREVTWFDEDEFTGEEIAMRKRYPVNLGQEVRLHGLEPDVQRIEWSGFYGPRGGMGAPSAQDVVEWAKTGRGGKVYDLVKASLDTAVCSSRYGLCE